MNAKEVVEVLVREARLSRQNCNSGFRDAAGIFRIQAKPDGVIRLPVQREAVLLLTITTASESKHGCLPVVAQIRCGRRHRH